MLWHWFFGGFSHADILAAVHRLGEQLNRQEDTLMAILDDLRAHVEYNTSVVNSAIALIGGLHAKLDAALTCEAGVDVAALTAIRDDLKAQTDALAAAVAANTVAETEAEDAAADAAFYDASVETPVEAPGEASVETPADDAPAAADETPTE